MNPERKKLDADSIKNLKEVKIFAGGRYHFEDDEEDEEQAEEEVSTGGGVPKLSNKEKMKWSLMYGCRKYYKPFGKLTNKLVRERNVKKFAHEILYWVVERTILNEHRLD